MEEEENEDFDVHEQYFLALFVRIHLTTQADIGHMPS